MRIVVVGISGTGKTTLATRISERLGILHIEMDSLHWRRCWTEAPLEELRQRVTQAVQAPGWVLDGNYSKVRDLVWSKAVLLVWLDYPLSLTLWRLSLRTIRRIITRVELWDGNRETLWNAVFTRDSLFRYAIGAYSRRRRQYPLLFASPEYSHLEVLRFRSPRQTEAWFSSLPDSQNTAEPFSIP